MYSNYRPIVAVLVGVLLPGPVGAVYAQADEPGDEEQAQLVQHFYEQQNDPTFSGEVTFLREVPLISSFPDCERSSQYWTGLVIYGRKLCRAQFLGHLEKAVRETIEREGNLKGLSRDPRRQLMIRVMEEALGPLTEAEIPEDLAPHGPPGHARQRSARLARRGPDGLVVTSGLDALRTVDARLKGAPDVNTELVSLLRTKGVRWRILRHEAVPGEECTRLLSRRVPFVAHRGETDYMVCGFASEQGRTYLMGFDMAKIECQVVLGGGATSVPYSRFLEIEREAKERDPNKTFDPLFGDYKAYFSSKNLPGFRLLRLGEFETISVLDPEAIDEREVREVIERAVADVMSKQKEKHPDGRP